MNKAFGRMTAAVTLVMAVAGMLFWMGCSEKEDNKIDDDFDPVPKATENFYGEDLEREAANNPDFAGAGRKFTGEYLGFVGSGYNLIDGAYWNSRDVLPRVLNVDKLIEDGKLYEDVYANRGDKTITAVGSNISSYSEKFSSEVGVSTKGLFSGSVQVNFGISTSTTATKSFGTISSEITKVAQYVELVSETDFQGKYIDEYFRDNFLLNDSFSPEDLLANYGTHILLKVELGGRLDMSYAIENTEKVDELTLQARVEASYGTVKGEAKSDYESKRSALMSNTQERIRREGGTALDMSTFDNAKKNYAEWAQSIDNTDYISFIKGGQNLVTQLIPIWKLVPTSKQARRDAIEKKYNDQLEAKGTWLEGLQPSLPAYIKNMYVGAGGSWSKAESDLRSQTTEDLYIIWKDLNKGAGGDDIFFAYTRTKDSTQAITRPGIRVQGDEAPPKSYVQDGNTFNIASYTDLNKGCSKGKDIYLYTTKGKASNYKPVTDLFVAIDYDFSGMNGTGWSREGDDLNRGAGGADIYLWFRR